MSSTDTYATVIDSHFRLRLFNITHTPLPFTSDTSAPRLPLSPLFTNNGEKCLINHLVYSWERMDSYMPNSKVEEFATQNRPVLFAAFTSHTSKYKRLDQSITWLATVLWKITVKVFPNCFVLFNFSVTKVYQVTNFQGPGLTFFRRSQVCALIDQTKLNPLWKVTERLRILRCPMEHTEEIQPHGPHAFKLKHSKRLLEACRFTFTSSSFDARVSCTLAIAVNGLTPYRWLFQILSRKCL